MGKRDAFAALHQDGVSQERLPHAVYIEVWEGLISHVTFVKPPYVTVSR